jgi:MFS superfamily sulfate permease-like transporter
MSNKLQATEEQLAYAKLLDLGMKIGLLMLVITFIIYLFGIFTPYIPVEELPNYWKLPVKEYLKVTGIHPGWTWLVMVGKGDFLNFIPIAFLAGVTILCYIRIVPILFGKKDTVYAFLAIIEVLVLVLAASGALKSGGH